MLRRSSAPSLALALSVLAGCATTGGTIAERSAAPVAEISAASPPSPSVLIDVDITAVVDVLPLADGGLALVALDSLTIVDAALRPIRRLALDRTSGPVFAIEPAGIHAIAGSSVIPLDGRAARPVAGVIVGTDASVERCVETGRGPDPRLRITLCATGEVLERFAPPTPPLLPPVASARVLVRGALASRRVALAYAEADATRVCVTDLGATEYLGCAVVHESGPLAIALAEDHLCVASRRSARRCFALPSLRAVAADAFDAISDASTELDDEDDAMRFRLVDRANGRTLVDFRVDAFARTVVEHGHAVVVNQGRARWFDGARELGPTSLPDPITMDRLQRAPLALLGTTLVVRDEADPSWVVAVLRPDGFARAIPIPASPSP